MRLTAVAAIVVLAVFAAAAVAQQAPAPAPGPGGGAPRLSPEQMFDQMATRIGLSDDEKAAGKAAIQQKTEAATTLGQELRALIQVLRNRNASDAELQAALKKYDTALAAYGERIKQIDAELSKRVSPRALVAMTVMGVRENGLRSVIAGGMGGRGEMRMRRGGGAPAPAPQ
jgi:hypothetical protein